MQFNGEELTFKRIFTFVFGLFVMSLGIAFSITSTLGTTPISSLAYAWALISNLSVGTTTFLFNAGLIVVQFFILRSQFSKKRWLQLINCVIFGYFNDAALYLVSLIPFDASPLMCFAYLVLSIFLLALGILIYLPSNIAPLPGEGCVEAISIVTGWRFSSVKIGFDATIVILALIMCGLWYTDIFGAVYIGTIISAFFIGFTIRQLSNIYTRITGRQINVVHN